MYISIFLITDKILRKKENGTLVIMLQQYTKETFFW